MKKIFSKEIFLTLVFILSSFFFLLPNVKAEEYNLLLDKSTLTIIDDNFYALRNKTLNFIKNNNNQFYFIRQINNSLYSYIYDNSFTYSLTEYNDNRFFVNISGSYCRYTFLNNELSKGYCGSSANFQIYYKDNLFKDNDLIDTNMSFIYNKSNVFNILYNGNIYSFKTGDNIPSFYDIISYEGETSTDNTPLLTSFIDLSIEKLAVICNFITSSYIYLAPFVILIFYFVILLFRRFR